MKKLLLILGMVFILGSILVGCRPVSSETIIVNHDCVEAEKLKDTLKASEDIAGIKISIKAFLAGPLNEQTGFMNTKLFEANYLPKIIGDTNFYDWYYPKQMKWLDFSPSCLEPIISLDRKIVDFVQVVLVEGNPHNPYDTVKLHWRLARLDSAGNIRDFNDKESYLKFFLPENKDYYVAVVHRNHNAQMSSIPIRGSYDHVTTYDFTSDINKIWGGYYGSIQIAGKWCMIPGDGAGAYQNGWDAGKGDQFTDLSDLFMCLNDKINGKKGYFDTDYNLDGIVNNQDVEIAEMYWNWGSAIPFCIPTGAPWGNSNSRRVTDYNLNGRNDSFDKSYHSFAQRNPFVFPTALDYNMDGIFDIKDRVDARNKLFSITENPVLIPTYRLDGKVVHASVDSISTTIYMKATSNERFWYNTSQYFVKVDTAQFQPTSVSISGDFNYSNPTILPSGIIGMLASVPNNGIIMISDSGNGTQICKMVIRGQRRTPGNSQQLVTWRNGPLNPFTKIFAVVDSFIIDVTTPETHFFVNSTTGMGNSQTALPKDFKLTQNYPNPFNPSTKINYELPSDGIVSIKLFDITGKEVATLVNEVKTAGYYTVTFNASNLPSGAYFYRLEAGSFIQTKKMMLIK
jgi:hypothetical protein